MSMTQPMTTLTRGQCAPLLHRSLSAPRSTLPHSAGQRHLFLRYGLRRGRADYFADFATANSWMAPVNYEQLCTRAQVVRASNRWAQIHQELDICVDLLVSQHSYWNSSPSDEHHRPHSRESLLGLDEVVMAYAGTTQIAFDDDLMQPGAHFIVLRYSNEFEGSLFRSMIVPAYLNDSDGVLSLAQFREIVAMMVNRDQQDHREWFD